jgi:hypothetical protein
MKFLYFARMYSKINGVDGEIVECGVGFGRSLLMLAYLLKDESSDRQIFAFDTFEGLPQPTE